ncbi:HypC/HybG/HupF family hydrogenase formation chaperone [Parasalinivibrio latis]|uniref:HypC/HybG/HupF family hydrogenase formation chaperone n=1 Tax=Parasalinivibrio latis TaxID=2952610 RepID=UPI0030E40561
MCIGTPMKVMECSEHEARCSHDGIVETVDCRLVGYQPPGTWLMVFLGAARSVISEDEAALINDALCAVAAAMDGETQLTGYFSDLDGCAQNNLPPHLSAMVSDQQGKES